MNLHLSTDRKTAPMMQRKYETGNEAYVRVPNAFGLPAIKSCWGSTPTCEAMCYARKLEVVFKGTRDALERNWQLVKPHLHDPDKLEELLYAVVEQSFKYMQKWSEPEDWVFRWFWDGDIPTPEFATAVRRVCQRFPQVKFWLYTRTFNAIRRLQADNLVVYLSVDKDNVKQARHTSKTYPWVKLAFTAESWAATEALARAVPDQRRGPRCPELTGKIPLVVWGEDRMGRGACVECGLCITGVNNVRFSASK